jgi:hypothetical protein
MKKKVYLLKEEEKFKVIMNEKEVRGYRWSPIYLLKKSEITMELKDKISYTLQKSQPDVYKLFGQQVIFREGMYLQNDEYLMFPKKDVNKDFFLWGLTLFLSNKLLKIVGVDKNDRLCSDRFFSDNYDLDYYLNNNYFKKSNL